jgi:hypothetical protein
MTSRRVPPATVILAITDTFLQGQGRCRRG